MTGERRRVVALREYDQVVAALEHPDLRIPGVPVAAPGASHGLAPEARRTLGAFEGDELGESLVRSAAAFVDRLPAGPPVDLLADFARPWSLDLAMRAARLPGAQSDWLNERACTIFLSAALSTDGHISAEAEKATTELATALGTLGEGSLDVQAFVALSQTLPCFLGAAWRELLMHPDQLRRLTEHEVTAGAIDELLRLAGPSRAVFRQAAADVRIGDVPIRAGDLVALMLADANRDESAFANANQLDFSRDASRHLAFGHRPHACVGAAVIRSAASSAMRALLPRFAGATLLEVAWIGGFAIRGPSALVASLAQNS